MNQTKETQKSIFLVTGNVEHKYYLNNHQQNKLKEFNQILGDRFLVKAQDVDLPEVQGDALQIAKDKAKIAYSQIKKACIVEDTSLCFNALKGMPGPYIKWFLQAVGPEGLSKMLDGFEDKSGYAQCIISYMGPELEEPIQFIGKTPGKIVRPRGPNNFGWDPCFQPDGYEQTYAEMEKELKNKISHRLRAIDEMVLYFNEKP